MPVTFAADQVVPDGHRIQMKMDGINVEFHLGLLKELSTYRVQLDVPECVQGTPSIADGNSWDLTVISFDRKNDGSQMLTVNIEIKNSGRGPAYSDMTIGQYRIRLFANVLLDYDGTPSYSVGIKHLSFDRTITSDEDVDYNFNKIIEQISWFNVE